MKKIISIFLFFSILLAHSQGAQYYATQSGAGSKNGTSLGNAWDMGSTSTGVNNAGNWSGTPGTAGKISGDDILTFSGNLTGSLSTQAGGTSGHPITINFAPGAKFSGSPYMGGVAITVQNPYIIVDGVDNSQTRFESLANGTSLANQVDCTFVHVVSSTNVAVKNCKGGPFYIRVIGADPNQYGDGVFFDSASSNCNNATADGNVFDNLFIGINSNWGNGASGFTITNNNVSYMNWGAYIADRGSSGNSLTDILVKGNTFSQWANWDDPTNNINHHNGVFLVWNNATGTVDGAIVTGNYFGAGTGDKMTGQVYCNGGVTNPVFINNIFTPGPGDSSSNALITVGGLYYATTVYVLNNTFNGENTNVAQFHNGFNVAASIVYKNNLEYGPFYAFIDYVPQSNGTLVSDYNLYYANGGSFLFADAGGIGGNTFSVWQGYGFDAHAVTTNPLLIGGGNYHLQSGSPARSAGINLTSLGISALDVDAAGVARPSSGAWDIGAFQDSNTSGSGGSVLTGKVTITGKATIR